MDPAQLLKRKLANEIRRRREVLGLSQEKFADSCGIHRTYIGAIERGERNITIGTLQKIADALECEITELIPQERKHA